jgi:hypothetical protein
VRLDSHLAVIRVIFHKEDEESGEEGENAGIEEGHRAAEGRGTFGGGERFDLVIVGESKSKSDQVGQSSRGLLQAGQLQLGEWLCRRVRSGPFGCWLMLADADALAIGRDATVDSVDDDERRVRRRRVCRLRLRLDECRSGWSLPQSKPWLWAWAWLG